MDEARAHEYLKDMGYEGLIAISFVNRTRFYGLLPGRSNTGFGFRLKK